MEYDQYPSICINIHQYPSISINIHQYPSSIQQFNQTHPNTVSIPKGAQLNIPKPLAARSIFPVPFCARRQSGPAASKHPNIMASPVRTYVMISDHVCDDQRSWMIMGTFQLPFVIVFNS
jgi:hypothetical protein